MKVIPPQLLAQCWVWVRSPSKLQDVESWRPSRGIRFPNRQSGKASFPCDRGDESLRFFATRQ